MSIRNTTDRLMPPQRLNAYNYEVMSSRARGEMFWQGEGEEIFYLSLALENVGSGVAAISHAETRPQLHGDIYLSQAFLPAGSTIRVNISVLTSMIEPNRFADQWWAMDGLDVVLHYGNSNGGKALRTEIHLRQFATKGPFVQSVDVYRRGRRKRLTTGRGDY